MGKVTAEPLGWPPLWISFPTGEAMAELLGWSPLGMAASLDLFPNRRGNGRALGMTASSDLFPISKAMAELLGWLTLPRRQGIGRALAMSLCGLHRESLGSQRRWQERRLTQKRCTLGPHSFRPGAGLDLNLDGAASHQAIHDAQDGNGIDSVRPAPDSPLTVVANLSHARKD
jgi:hypothetical protein